MGITGDLLDWIRDFLHNRMMRVIVNGECSTLSHVWSGIPQGSVLGPLLFWFSSTIYQTDIGTFAGDTKIWTNIASKEDSGKLLEDLNNLSKWSEKWVLQFNPEKCVVMHAEEVCDRNRVVPQVLHCKLCRMALTVGQMFYGVWCHSTLRTNIWYAAGDAGLVTVQNPTVTRMQLGESGMDWPRQQTFKRWDIRWWSSNDSGTKFVFASTTAWLWRVRRR